MKLSNQRALAFENKVLPFALKRHTSQSHVTRHTWCPVGWNSDWAAVSEVFSPAPPSKLDIKWENSRLVKPGDTIPVTVMEERPTQLRWTAERGALYTVMLLDAGEEFIHTK